MYPGKRTGYASLPLHGGRAPAWLFSRMVLLSREILTHIVEEFGANEVLRRMSDPFWFQAFGCVLGAWHSSGVTTTVCGAVKESLRETGPEWGLFAAGGKGATSKKSPAQIGEVCQRPGREPDALELIYGTSVSTRDPARFAFAHGVKDGIPFPVDRPTYDRTIEILKRAVDRARIDRSERVSALKRLAQFNGS